MVNFVKSRLYLRVIALGGWRRWALTFLLGVLAAGAMAPLHGVFLLVPGLSGLLWLVFSKGTARAAFGVGWWFGFGHFSAGLYWVANALLTYPDRFGWMAPFAVFGLAAVLALFPACVTVLTRLSARRCSGIGRVLVFAALWTTFEWLRSWVFTGFPWNLIGSVWAFSDPMIQLSALAGVYGLGLLTVIVAAMPALLAGGDEWAVKGSPLRPLTLAVLALVVVWAGGAVRLSGATADRVPDVRLRLVQPNIDQKLKWDRQYRSSHFNDQLAMSVAPPSPGVEQPTHVIWAETATTFFISKDGNVRKALAGATPKGGLLMTGAPRTSSQSEPVYRVWNSFQVIDEEARIVGTYDKSHMVPFGEYMPFRKVLNLAKITDGATDFSPGPGPKTLRLKGLPPVSPLICYEVIFPGEVVDQRDRPEWLLNLTNDGWYGVSSGPYQHFAAARFRAAEQGLPLVRVANTGISGVVDGYGRVIAKLGLSEQGVLDSALPSALGPTLYGRLGDWIVILLVLLVSGAGLLMKPGRRAG
ncbi:MAG: apolipoprotein N-acyltransferase [Rhodospirillaceae bacterium]|mgnify:CR=1 FL=1|jgi:apolipoprotein N-acyltransferase|nr:apolipoprotein N-acyltransferase [Rhodospirillaceae bacterium]MBT5243061.1 apolipoprotein N-acyltransferase [Rhodospirillaceae bacterium]MBT5563286.1 apolipoprotein N-acyltransferase [Rhodospirillaceae bacterium]MBT6243600.1 apolipoprotein N-acyltransferase [Rhodospirillaceae bacterium]MBT7136468.1 apolipoprotein N-acyltransferase [Rhodospirillaceae bacterium]